MQQKHRSSKSKIMGRRNSMGGRRNSLSGGAPLEPIYENEGSPSTKRSSFGEESEFQIVMDNASNHSEFVNSSSTHRRMLSSPTKAQQLQGEGRWGNGDFNISKDSNSSINTASTSSLTAFPYDAEEEYEDFFEEGVKDNNSNSHNNKMTSTEIIQHATDVVAGKYDYNNNNNASGTSSAENSSSFHQRSSSRRRQLRRSSLPTMPVRQESLDTIDLASEAPPSTSKQVSESSSSAVAVDKFGIPIASSHARRKPRERRSSMPSRRGSDPTSKSESKESDGYADTIAAQADKFGIPITQIGTTGRRRQGRRSSMGDSPSKPAEPKAVVDKYGIPIAPSLESNSNHSASRSRRRHLRRSSMGDSPTKPEPQALVDKYGVPIAPSLESKSSHSSRSRRRHGRRSSMGDSPTKPEPQVVDKYGIPITPSLESNSNHSTSRSRRRQGRRSSMGDSPSKPVEGPALVDKFGIPIQQSLESGSNHSSRTRHRKQSRRSSMPTSTSIDAAGQLAESSSSSSMAPSLEASSSTHGSRRQGRRSSDPTRRAPRRSVSFDLPSSSDEEKKDDSFHLRGSVTVDKFGIPVWPKELASNNNRRRKQERRSSMPTTPTSKREMYSANQNSLRRGRRPSTPIERSSANASSQRFVSEDGNIPRSLSPANNAPIRPERVPSMENFSGEKGKANYQVAQPNAKFEIVEPPKKTINNNNKLESIVHRPSTDSKSTNTKESLDTVLGNSRWGDAKPIAKTQTNDLGCDMSVNSMQQKDGEWWW